MIMDSIRGDNMRNMQEYEAVSRVVSGKNVIGLMVKESGKSKKDIYMSMDVLCFALCENAFVIKDVKLGNNGKPRGYNGFLLSKLPLVELEEEEIVKKKLTQVLSYLVSALDIKNKEDKSVSYCRMGINQLCILNVKLDEFSEMDIDLANTELGKLLKFYQKHLPKDFKHSCDKITGKVEKNGTTVIHITKSMVKEDV